jgi:hypothetical protein
MVCAFRDREMSHRNLPRDHVAQQYAGYLPDLGMPHKRSARDNAADD